MKQIKLIDKNWRILQKGGPATYGAGSTSSKYVRINSSIERNSMNNYTMTVKLSTSSGYVYNEYGQRVYAHIGGKRVYLGTSIIDSGACSPSTFTYKFSISSNTSCYASTICAYCEDGYHKSYYSEFSNQTSADIATYEVPGTAPTNPKVSLDKTGVAEGIVIVSATYDCSNPYGTVYYMYATSTDGSNWSESYWTTASKTSYSVTDIKRGATHYFKVKVKNGIGESGWSSSVSVKANSIPNAPTTLTVNTTRPVNSVTLNWSGASDPDGQTLTYKAYISKNSGSWSLIATTTSTSYSYNISADAQGTKYRYKIEAHDTLGAYSTSSESEEFIKGTQPYVTGISSNKTGIVEGSVIINCSSACSYPPDTTQYQFAYYYDGIGWQEGNWQSSSSYTSTISSQRGKNWYYKVRVKNSAGTSDWSSTVSVKSNNAPTTPTSLYVDNTRPISSVKMTWNASSDADGHTLAYNVYISKNNGSKALLTTTSATSFTYNISADAQGTKYQFHVEAYDTLSCKSGLATSGEFFKATQPSDVKVSLNKSGVAEGSVTATGIYNCPYPPSGTLYYQFSYYYTGTGWKDQEWTTLNSFSTTVTTQRGKIWYYKLRMKNDAGTSDWSSIVSITANSIPTQAINLSHSPKYPVNSMTLSWKAATDIDKQDLTYKVYLSKNGGAYSLISTTSATNCTYNNSNDAYETKYKFKVETYDSLGAYSTSEISKEFFKPTPPSTPNMTSPSLPIYEDNFSVKWTLSNFYKLNGYYVSQKKINDGAWTQLAENSTMTTILFLINSVNRGDTVQLRVKAVNEAGQESSWSSIVTIKRNRVPTAVTNIKPDSGYRSNIIDFSWSAATDPDNHSVKYNLYISKNSGNYEEVGTTAATSYKWAIPSQDTGETTYRLKVVTEDELGATNSATGPLLTKPTPPSKPTNLLPTSGYYEGSVTLSWTHSNWYNQTGEYLLEIFNDGKLSKTVSVPSSSSSYSYSLANTARGAKIHYRIKAKNIFNQESVWVENNSNVYHNQIPGTPSFVKPLSGKTTYSNAPKIVLKSSVEEDGQKMVMYVKYNGSTYNSKDNPSFFSKTSLGNNEYIIFKHTDSLSLGSNTIEAYVNDGLINSQKTSIIINKEQNVSAVNQNSLCTATDHNNRVKAINKVRESYGLSPYSLRTVIVGTDYVKAEYISEMIKAIKELTNNIDSYHADNKFKYSFSYSEPSKDTTFILNSHYNQISNSINNI